MSVMDRAVESDKASKARVEEVRREIAEREEQRKAMRAQWLREKELIKEMRDLQLKQLFRNGRETYDQMSPEQQRDHQVWRRISFVGDQLALDGVVASEQFMQYAKTTRRVWTKELLEFMVECEWERRVLAAAKECRAAHRAALTVNGNGDLGAFVQADARRTCTERALLTLVELET